MKTRTVPDFIKPFPDLSRHNQKEKHRERNRPRRLSLCFSIFQFKELKYTDIFNFQLSIFNYSHSSAVTNSLPFRDCPPSSATVAFP